jgi:hypothetical protein
MFHSNKELEPGIYYFNRENRHTQFGGLMKSGNSKSEYLFLIFIAFFLCSCSEKPGQSDLQEQLLPTMLQGVYADIASIENLEKTNGREVDANTYAVEYKNDLVFKISKPEVMEAIWPGSTDLFQAIGDLTGALIDEASGNKNSLPLKDIENKPKSPPSKSFEAIRARNLNTFDFNPIMKVLEPYGDFKVGDRFTQTGTAIFVMTEKGWKLKNQ